MSATSCGYRWYWSQATSPVSPPRTRPGVLQNVSQIEGPRPSSDVAPSTWYAEVAEPHRKSSGTAEGRGDSGTVLVDPEAALGIEEVQPGRVDGELERLPRGGARPRVQARDERRRPDLHRALELLHRHAGLGHRAGLLADQL